MAKKILLMDREKSEKKKKRKIIVPLFIIAIMVLSTAGYMIVQQKDLQDSGVSGSSMDYNGLKFYSAEGNRWVVNVGSSTYVFDNPPDELKDVQVPLITVQMIPLKVYMMFNASKRDGNMDYSMQKLNLALTNLGKKVVLACVDEQDCPDIPIKSCKNDELIFYLDMGENMAQSIKMNQDCIVLGGDALGLSKSVDAFNLKLISGV